MPNTVQLTQNGQPVYPVTDVSLITGLEERSGMRVIPYTTRPTASAETAGFIYMDESTQDLYITKATSGSYSWVSAGNLSNINLDNYATKTELEQLGQEVHNLSGKYYGVFTSPSSLPEGDAAGYAFVGTAAPFAIYNFDGTNWADSGATVDGVSGEPGVGFTSVSTPTPADGTVTITLSNGDTMTLDLNHDHLVYPKYHLCQSGAEYNNIAMKDANTLYLIPEEAIYLGDVLIVRSGSPLPYTPVDYIETDGTAYIDTGIKGNAPMSVKAKITPATIASGNRYILGCRKDSGATRFAFVTLNATKHIGFAYSSGVFVDAISIDDSFDNVTPVEVRSSFQAGTQMLSAKQYGEQSYTNQPGASEGSINTGLNIWLFKYNYPTTPDPGTPGLRFYSCKIYSDASFGTLVWDGVPCVYNGEYGMWDKVSNSFFGNDATSGAFTGPQI